MLTGNQNLNFFSFHCLLCFQALEIARTESNQTNNETAKNWFIKRIEESDMYYAYSIPKNESDEDAHNKCSSMEGAKKYCPVRWAAMQQWFTDANEVSSLTIWRILAWLLLVTFPHVLF